MDIQLFLARDDDHQAVLPEGIPPDALALAPPLASAPAGSSRIVRITAQPDSLPEHRWGILAPKGPEGDRLLELLQPLREKRERDQGAAAVVYRVDPGMDASASALWIQRDYWDAVGRREADLPRYLAILGGPAGVSWSLQQQLSCEAFVGRIAASSEGGYTAYVKKVLAWEGSESEPEPGAGLLFFTAQDGTKATMQGYKELMAPSLAFARERGHLGALAATHIVDIGEDSGSAFGGGPSDPARLLLDAAARSRASVLFSMSHGAGAPKGGWISADEQRARQGTMTFGQNRPRIAAADVAAQPFLPGGFWLFFACFGAGTPERSAYYPWVQGLHQLGLANPAQFVLEALPKPNEPPFVAALPLAALENPDGPLGVIGHVDLAWSWSFLEHELAQGTITSRRRAERFQGVLQALVDGHRLGVAHYELVRFSRTVSAELVALYGDAAGRSAQGDTAAETTTQKARSAGLWMQFQDLNSYVLLGDPAARLPIARRPPGVAQAAPVGRDAPPPAAPAKRDFASMEEAVIAHIRGAETPAAIAARHAISEATLDDWVNAFFDGGRPGLRRLR